MEQIPENIPSCSLDDAVDLNCVKKFLDSGWEWLLHDREETKKLPIYCTKGQTDADNGQSVYCDSCLNWQHFRCAGIRALPLRLKEPVVLQQGPDR